MYFEQFPLTYYSLDDKKTIQIVTDITRRNIIDGSVSENYSFFETYDVKEGETPDIVADKFYENSELHWIVLHANNILDPRFEWPLGYVNLVAFVDNKYIQRDGTHHYENSNNEIVVGNLFIESSNFANFVVGDVIVNETNEGVGVIVSKLSSANVIINVSVGGFKQGDDIKVINEANILTISSTTSIGCVPVTNFLYEERLNEIRRRIKILKPQYVEEVVKDFNIKIGT